MVSHAVQKQSMAGEQKLADYSESGERLLQLKIYVACEWKLVYRSLKKDQIFVSNNLCFW